MPSQLGPIEISCDAPPYHIVRACQQIGIESPEDVRWCRMSHFLHVQTGWRELFKRQPWKLLREATEAEHRTCSCRQPLPNLDKFTFTLISGKELSYHMGQCRRCLTVYWEEA